MNKNTIKLQKGEAEELVKKMREHLRVAQTHSQQGNQTAENREIRESEIVFGRLIDGIHNTLKKYASRCCPRNKSDMEDLVQEMTIGIFQEIRRTEATPHCLFYEENFTVALKGCLHNVVKAFGTEKAGYYDSFTRASIKQKQAEKECAEGKRESVNCAPEVELPVSLNSPVGDGESGEQKIDAIKDRENLHAMENVLTKEVLQVFYAELSPQDCIFVAALHRGYSPGEAASKAGIPPRTAYDRRKKFNRRLCDLFGIPSESGGAVD